MCLSLSCWDHCTKTRCNNCLIHVCVAVCLFQSRAITLWGHRIVMQRTFLQRPSVLRSGTELQDRAILQVAVPAGQQASRPADRQISRRQLHHFQASRPAVPACHQRHPNQKPRSLCGHHVLSLQFFVRAAFQPNNRKLLFRTRMRSQQRA